MNLTTVREMNAIAERESMFLHDLRAEINKVIVGQETLVDRVLIALLADGHILLEGVPGLAKTLLIKTVAEAIDADFSRLQFTPDLLPADLVGTQIYNPKTGEFITHQGPLFANLVLADEVNRAPGKVQSALLEVHAGTPDHHRQTHPYLAGSLPGNGNPKSHRAGRHLSAARSTGRPLHAQSDR